MTNKKPNQKANQVVWYPGHELMVSDIVRADNCHLFDAAGKRYVDLESGVWCTPIGHGHPEVLRTMAEQAAQIAHTGFNYSSGVVESAARSILSLLSFDGGRCVFLCSGSEAVEYGVRTAQALIKRPLVLTMADSYFGAYGAASQKSADRWWVFDWTPCSVCPFPDECGRQCDHWNALPLEDIGGFLFEPGSSSGLVRFPPKKLIERGKSIGKRLYSGLQGTRKRSGMIEAIRARGPMIAVELKDREDFALTPRIHRELSHRGYLVGRRPGINVLRLDPALTIELADLEGFLSTFEAVLSEVDI